MKAAIENFARIPMPDPGVASPDPGAGSAGGKILVLGAMAELGPESLEEHRQIIDLIGQYQWKAVLLVGGDFQRLEHPYVGFENAMQARDWLRNARLRHAYLLVKGSRSMKMEEALG
jgi:UDP-N-acetylmuramoyl-tripeptide--D-alanyl-D-alanine ligase